MIKIRAAFDIVFSILILSVTSVCGVYAEDLTCEPGKNGISISPVSQPFSISANEEVSNEFTVKNINSNATTFSVAAAPYSMMDEDYTAPNFSNNEENYTRYTQIARWIRFEDSNGSYVETLKIDIDGCAEKKIKYKILVPDSIPNGGQYAVILVRSNDSNSEGSIRTVPQVGLLISARAVGETVRQAEISDVFVSRTYSKDENVKNVQDKINASGLVKNTGNVDLEIKTNLVVKNIFGGVLYENEASVSVLPETTRKVNDVWEDTPLFGLFWASYTVKVNGESSNNAKLLLIMPFWMIVMMLVLVAVVIIWVIAMVKRYRTRKARLLN